MANFAPSVIVRPATLRSPVFNSDPSAARGDDLADMLAALLPPGRAWNFKRGGVALRLIDAIATELARTWLKVDELLREIDPGTAHALLAEWEAALGLPDPCLGGTFQDEEARRAAVVAKIQGNAPITLGSILNLAASIGQTATYFSLKTARAGSMRSGDRCYGVDFTFVFGLVALASGPTPPASIGCTFAPVVPAGYVLTVWNGAFSPAKITRPAKVSNPVAG